MKKVIKRAKNESSYFVGYYICESVTKEFYNLCFFFLVLRLGCVINFRDIGEPQPLLLRAETEEFMFPASSRGEIKLNKGEVIELYCSNGFRGPFEAENTIFASCVSDTQFFAGGERITFNQLACNELPDHKQIRTNATCADGSIFEIGFQAENKWVNLMTVCHNEELGSTSWVHYFQNPENQGFQRAFPRIPFIQGEFYEGLAVNNLYTRNVQRRTIANILGSPKLSADLIAAQGDLFLSRGHLAARSDFIYGVHQQASFYFLNAAPQWQTFNGGNWATLEDHLKRYIDRKNINAEIYTGTYGILTYNDTRGATREIFLASDRRTNDNRIPVPKAFYKVVLVPETRSGIVFIGINNPYISIEEIKRDYSYCENVMDKVNYIPWNRRNLRQGYLYACSVNEFAKFVGHLPNIAHIDHLLI